MTYATFLSTVAVVALLAGVALLVVLSALTLAPLNNSRRSYTGAFVVCLIIIWVGAVLIIFLMKAQDMTP
jgi:amino acid transporter